jgi:hypothetical protein
MNRFERESGQADAETGRRGDAVTSPNLRVSVSPRPRVFPAFPIPHFPLISPPSWINLESRVADHFAVESLSVAPRILPFHAWRRRY